MNARDSSAAPPATARDFSVVNWAADRAWRVLVIVALLALGVFVLLELKMVVIPLLFALLATSVLNPVAGAMSNRGMNRGLAATITICAALAAAIAVGLFVIPPIVDQFRHLDKDLAAAMNRIYDWLSGPPINLNDAKVVELRHKTDDLTAELGKIIASGFASTIPLFIEVIATAVFAIVFTGYMLHDGDRYWRWILGFVDDERRGAVDGIGRNAHRTLAHYVQGTSLVALFDSVFIGLGLAIIGVPLVIPLAVIVFFGSFLPIIGAWVTGTLAFLVALSSGGLTDALAVAVLILVVQQLEGTFIQPLFVGRKVNLAPIVTLATVTAGTAIGGFVGGVLSVPLVATISGALGEVRRLNLGGVPATRTDPSSSAPHT